MDIGDDARALLEEVLAQVRREGVYPEAITFRLGHEPQRPLIDDLLEKGLLAAQAGHYLLTLQGLLALGSEGARQEVAAANGLLDLLKECFRAEARKDWTVQELSKLAGKEESAVARSLTFLSDLPICSSRVSGTAGLVERIRLAQGVLDCEPLSPPGPQASQEHEDEGLGGGSPRLVSLEVSGYRLFEGFTASPGDLTVIIGANAAGKSSLFDFLRFVAFATSNPLPPEIDPSSFGRRLFPAGGPERLSFALNLDVGMRSGLRYEVELHGPLGTPRVVRESLETHALPGNALDGPPRVFIARQAGTEVRSFTDLPSIRWAIRPNELILRRTLAPHLAVPGKVQAFVSSWSFYSQFNVSMNAAIRRPALSQEKPTLAEDGSNLSAVLFDLMTEHPELWQELESNLETAIPGFQSLAVKPRGAPGTVIGIWRERGLKDELTLADLSDGTLRLLCLAALCLSPNIPPLVCIDEPELGLHPRVLPMLAGLLKLASARSQILVATHSPYFLAQFELDHVAVMRKEEGRAVFVRPGSSRALRREVEEIGGSALAQMHISDELEGRS